jgi:hypothetical protein
VEPTKDLVDAIYRERILRARDTAPEEKLFDGPRLFDLSCRIMMDGIRDQFPDANARQVQEILTKRLDLLRRLRESP